MKINDKIDMLTIIKRLPNDKYRNMQFECKCDCGKIVKRSARTLRNTNFHSCGCKRALTKNIISNCAKAGKARAEKRNIDGINVDMLFSNKNISTNTSGYKGISWSKTANKWHVYVGYKNYRCNLGFYESIDTAYKIRNLAIDAIKQNTFEDFFYELRGFRIEDKLTKIY